MRRPVETVDGAVDKMLSHMRETQRVCEMLERKMALDLDYLPGASVAGDLRIMLQTASVLLQKAVGRKNFPTPRAVEQLLHQSLPASVLPFTSEEPNVQRKTAA